MTDHPPVLTPAPRRSRPQGYRTFQIAVTLLECYATAEIAWYLTHDEHLYEVIGDRLNRLHRQIAYRVQIADTLRMIRRLPERGH